jgi:hypothetical protein
MRNSFVALISRFGLESLLPECDAACRWSLEATRRRPMVCAWAVIERQIATEIVELLLAGDGDTALYQLTARAECQGPMFESPVLSSHGSRP